jgi:hypothetical protein
MSRMSTLVKVDRRAFGREREDLNARLAAWESDGANDDSNCDDDASASASGPAAPTSGAGVRDVKEGYLQKQSRSGFKDWKKRWFVVKGGMMYYYRRFVTLRANFTSLSHSFFFLSFYIQDV